MRPEGPLEQPQEGRGLPKATIASAQLGIHWVCTARGVLKLHPGVAAQPQPFLLHKAGFGPIGQSEELQKPRLRCNVAIAGRIPLAHTGGQR